MGEREHGKETGKWKRGREDGKGRKGEKIFLTTFGLLLHSSILQKEELPYTTEKSDGTPNLKEE